LALFSAANLDSEVRASGRLYNACQLPLRWTWPQRQDSPFATGCLKLDVWCFLTGIDGKTNGKPVYRIQRAVS